MTVKELKLRLDELARAYGNIDAVTVEVEVMTTIRDIDYFATKTANSVAISMSGKHSEMQLVISSDT